MTDAAQRLFDAYFKALKIAGKRNVFEVMAELLESRGKNIAYGPGYYSDFTDLLTDLGGISAPR